MIQFIMNISIEEKSGKNIQDEDEIIRGRITKGKEMSSSKRTD